jgi:multiphosphoryl transfer protein
MSGAILTLGAPLEGWAAPLEETGDPVFAERMLGDGIAIDPVVGELRAPCDGEVIGIHAAHHAVTLKAANGAEILMHVGLETVALGGAGFSPNVAVGERVAAGAVLLRFDLDSVARGAKSLISPVVVINGEAAVIERAVVGRAVRFGEPIMTLRLPAAAEPAVSAAEGGVQMRRSVRVGLAHGLHARPAAMLARCVGGFQADVSLALAGRHASARSPVSIMTLGVRRGDEIVLSASGHDAAAALDAVAALVATATPEPEPTAPAPLPPAAPTATQTPKRWQGVAAAPGLAIGSAVRLIEPEVALRPNSGSVPAEHAALNSALDAAKDVLARRLTAAAADGRDIVEAHLAFLDDPELLAGAQAGVADGQSAGEAWRAAIEGYVTQLRATGDARMLERAADLADLERQVLMQLSGDKTTPIRLPDNAILLADEILPSQLMELGAGRIAGLAVGRGGPTSHVAILAAAMDIPAVVALGPGLIAIENGALAILDGDAGLLQVGPGAGEIAAAQTRLSERRERRSRAKAAAHEPCITADGIRIEVFANLGAVDDAAAAVEQGAEGCGLLRTEFLFMDRDRAPDEEEQRATYQAIADTLAGRPLVVRTLDVGADKPVSYLAMPPEENPALGLRGLRVGLAWPELLRTQLRAIIKVRPAGQARILLPMVASLGELRVVRAMVAELAEELGLPAPAVGVMVETPAAAVTADLLAAEADFLSVGTNDLAQYALAMDRTNARFAAEVDALHPAVLRLIGDTVAGAARRGRPVAVCGSLASDIAAAPILIGLGAVELSAGPAVVPELKAAIRLVTVAQCRDLAARAVNLASAAEVRALEIAATGQTSKGVLA